MGLAEEIVRRVRPALWAFVAANCRSDMAEDVLQEVLVAITKNLPSFAGSTDPAFWKWCYQIARNKISNQFRRHGTQPLAAADEEEIWRAIEASAKDKPLSPGDRVDLNWAMELLRQAKPPCYGFLWEHYILGWDYYQVAKANGLRYDAARVKIGRCLRLVQSLVQTALKGRSSRNA
jgi:RNA polymerase sigma factor (sigma-70 family)